MLNKETKVGMTIGQLIGFVGLIVAICSQWINVMIWKTQVEASLMKQQTELTRLDSKIESNRTERITQISELKMENKEDHKLILDEVKSLRDWLMKNK
jgi:hypothetical protein